MSVLFPFYFEQVAPGKMSDTTCPLSPFEELKWSCVYRRLHPFLSTVVFPRVMAPESRLDFCGDNQGGLLVPCVCRFPVGIRVPRNHEPNAAGT